MCTLTTALTACMYHTLCLHMGVHIETVHWTSVQNKSQKCEGKSVQIIKVGDWHLCAFSSTGKKALSIFYFTYKRDNVDYMLRWRQKFTPKIHRDFMPQLVCSSKENSTSDDCSF